MIMKSDILFIQFLKKGKVSRMLALSRKKDEAIIINKSPNKRMNLRSIEFNMDGLGIN